MTISSEFRYWLDERLRLRSLSLLGVVELHEEPYFPHFKQWLASGKQAGMKYLERYQDLRQDPRRLLPGAKSAIIVGLNYFQGDRLRAGSANERLYPRIAQYARLQDYHKVLRQSCDEVLQEVLQYAANLGFGVGEGRSLVDSAPILERALAARTADGFIGKNTCFIHPRQGSFFLLAEILTTLPLPQDKKKPVIASQRQDAGGCGSCKRCQVYCPTGALQQDYSLNAKRCLAYWTIEHRGTIPEEFWPHLATYYFGCDLCQLACPYNRLAKIGGEGLLRLKVSPDLFAVATMDQAAYEQMFAGTPMTRAKREGLIRNALIAMTVTKHARLSEAVAHAATKEQHPTILDTLAQIQTYQAH